MWKFEIRKLIFKEHMLGLVFVLAIAFLLFRMVTPDRTIEFNLFVESDKEYYLDCVNQIQSSGTFQKISGFKKNHINELLKTQMKKAKENPKRYKVIYQNGWITFFGKMKMNYFYLILLVMIIVPIFGRDYEFKMDSIITSTKNGRTKLFFTKMHVTFWICMLIGIVLYGTELFVVHIKYGLSDWSAPIQSIVLFEECDWNLSIMQLVMLGFLITCVGLLFSAIVVHVFVLLFKNINAAMVGSLLFMAIPKYAIAANVLYYLPIPTAYLDRHDFLMGLYDENVGRTFYFTAWDFSIGFGKVLLICLLLMGIEWCLYLHIYQDFAKPRWLKKLGVIFSIFCLTGCAKNSEADNCIYNYFNEYDEDLQRELEDKINPFFEEGGSVFLGEKEEDTILYAKIYESDLSYAIGRYHDNTNENEILYKSDKERLQYHFMRSEGEDVIESILFDDVKAIRTCWTYLGNLYLLTTDDEILMVDGEALIYIYKDKAIQTLSVYQNQVYIVTEENCLLELDVDTSKINRIDENVKNVFVTEECLTYTRTDGENVKKEF